LQVDASGRVVPGLCTGWSSASGYRTWRFTGCRSAAAIAAELRRVGRLRASPANWIFSSARSIGVPATGVVEVRLREPWRRFPYAMTAVAAAPPGVPGPFHVVRATRGLVELRGLGKTLVFRHLAGEAALRAYRNGVVDEAPVPLGDIGRFRAYTHELRVRPLLAQDLVVFRPGAVPLRVRRVYWQTANRDDYQALVAEDGATAALGLVGTPPKQDPAAFRRAVGEVPSLPSMRVRIAVPNDPTLHYGAGLLLGQWREVGLGPQLVPQGAPADASFRRVLAVYPQDEALLGALGLPASLGSVDQQPDFDHVDANLRRDATIIPIAWVADARLVSPSLSGWQESVLGDVDYTRVAR